MTLMADFSVRIATPEDASQICGVLARSYSTLYRGWYRDDILAKALPAMTRANPRLLASGRYFIAECEDCAVACGGWSHDATRAHVRHFATDPQFLNQGCASALLRRSMNEARKSGFSEMESVSSLAAEAFYAHHGFKPLSIVKTPMGGASFSCVLMRRTIA